MTKDVDPHEQTAAEPDRPAASSSTLAKGRRIGGYELVSVLGEGGMGQVWRAHDPDLDRQVAIKVLKREDAAPSLRRRLLREARAMARLKHPNVMTVYEVGTEGDRDFIAMELVEGSGLDGWLAGYPPREAVISALLAAGRGLAAAHRAGLVHRDFKPHNILRSRDGRVLVTDFGLARGLGDDSASGETEDTPEPVSMTATLPAPAHTDSVLDAPLTQTGALIGTPAYMAPEQFGGAPPDPRTDQFAYCVTAWQALTGARPFEGNSLDELRGAVSAGVKASPPELSPAVRAVLVRGLDPDRAKRWPDMDTLLAELEHALAPPRRRPALIGIALALFAIVIALVLVFRGRGSSENAGATGCEPAEQAFAEAWSPEMRTKVWSSIETRAPQVTPAMFERLARPFDEYRTAWLATYRAACEGPADKLPTARINCLLGARDQVATFSQMLTLAPPPVLRGFDAHGMLPVLAVCDGPSPSASPAIPQDKRLRVINLLATTMAQRGRQNLGEVRARLEQEVTDIGWEPLRPQVHALLASEYLRQGEPAKARELYASAVRDAERLRDVRLVAVARIGLLDAALAELEDPSDASAITAALTHARAAIKHAGNDPMLAGALAYYEADLAARDHDYARAIEKAREARTAFERGGDARRAVLPMAAEAEVVLARGGTRAIDDALFIVRTAEENLERAGYEPSPMISQLRGDLEMMRGSYDAAHQAYDRVLAEPRGTGLVTITGKVVDTQGKPVGGARVVAWRGEMRGDPRRLYTSAADVDGEVTTSAADGTFTVRGVARAAIAAEADGGSRRATPIVAAASPVVLRLQPVRPSRGTAEGPDLRGVRVTATYLVGGPEHRFILQVPVIDGAWELPAIVGAYAPASEGPAGEGVRRVAPLPLTQKFVRPGRSTVEVIVRLPGIEQGATAWVFPARHDNIVDRADMEGRVSVERDATTVPLHPIGAGATDAGREMYRRGDWHAVIPGLQHGRLQVCAAASPRPTAPVVCTVHELAATPSVTPVVVHPPT